MIEIKTSYQIPNMYLNNLIFNDFKDIKYYRQTWVKDLNDEKILYYPGFSFSSEKIAQFYYNKIYQNFIKLNVFTPPRGNLSKFNNTIILGIKPGIFNAKFDWYESAWLFGPSVIRLFKLLKLFKIYPYFTNVYHNPFDDMNKNLNLILEEFKIVLYIMRKLNKIKLINIITLGKYDEFELVKNEIKINNIKFINIFHPSFICRKPYMFNKWVKKLGEQL